MTDEVKDVNKIVDLIVDTFEIYGARDVSPDVLINIREIILSHGRVMRHQGRIEANENSIKIIEGVFGK
tara:strand:- start:43 stop:249 length:207 start_codon:yes stop_codon:yes gene_type:complete